MLTPNPKRNKRKFKYLYNKRQDITEKEMYETSKLKIRKIKGFLSLLQDQNLNIDLLKQYDYNWYQWLYLWYNPKTKHKKIIGFEDIPFYHRKLEDDYRNLYESIVFKDVFLKESFLELSIQFNLKTKTYDELFENRVTLEVLENIQSYGAFYYKLSKRYTFFEMSIKNKSVISNEKINIPRTKLINLSKHLFYFGIIEKKGGKRGIKKPYFLNYYSQEELKKNSRFRAVERMNHLKNNLKQLGILNNTLEGNLIWDIDDIQEKDRKNDVLVFYSKGALFDSNECFILKGES